jgi:microcystin-dependent protein
MASTYSTTLRIELIGNGDQSGTWGDTTNSNLGDLIEAAITNVVDINFVDSNYTLSANNGLPDEARNAVLNLVGTNSAQRNLIAPAVEKTYVIKNGTGANVSITTNGAGANVVVQNGETQQVFCDGTNFYLSNVVLGTGSGAVVYANSPTISSPTLTGTPVAPTAAVSTDSTQIATTAFVRDIIPTGLISLWSGSVASIPSGWLLCDGSSGTPDLRNRFIVGAGSTYAVAATGGSADAIVVSHTHTATSAVTDPGHTHNIQNQNQGTVDSELQSARGNGTNLYTVPTDSAFTGITVATTVASAGSSGTNANLPPYYALAYIMKS